MEKLDIIVPTPGESISEVEIGSWLVGNGSWVDQDQEIASIESEKASLEITAPSSGFLEILAQEGEAVAVGSLMGKIVPGNNPNGDKMNEVNTHEVSDPAQQADNDNAEKQDVEAGPNENDAQLVKSEEQAVYHRISPANNIKITPVARKMMNANKLSIDDVLNGMRRISKQDIVQVLSDDRKEERKRMSLLRRKLSERLVTVKNETAMLTTFNELDMSAVISLRSKYKQAFEKKHGVKLGFMSFFSLAAARALQAFPQINSSIDGEDLISYNYADIGIAMQAPKGLMVPVIRDVHLKTLARIEADIAVLARKARNNKISMDELKGGTFSITNGGVFGSLLSTPILNPPQSAILGMHNITDRPVAIDQQVVIRPMMYIALSYDHRIVDGKDSVGFLKAIKELIENPFKLLDPAGKPENSLFDL